MENDTLKKLLGGGYGLTVASIEKSSVGAGSDTYFVECTDGKYVVKFPAESEMNNPEAEPMLCDYLLKKGVSVSEFIKNKDGNFISEYSGRKFHVQRFVEGKTYELNTAPDWLLSDSAHTLGKIHAALKDYVGLSEGIGEGFFRFMTPQNATNSYKNSLEIARKNGDKDVEADLLYRLSLMERFPDFGIDVKKLTCVSTHGDYFLSQLIVGEGKINAVIDRTTACVHPAVWEITRSYVYAAKECAGGEIDIPKYLDYVGGYLEEASLNAYDINMLGKLFCYQIAVCDYYGQYYGSNADNREIYLHQATFSTGLLKWFESNLDKLTDAATKRFSA